MEKEMIEHKEIVQELHSINMGLGHIETILYRLMEIEEEKLKLYKQYREFLDKEEEDNEKTGTSNNSD